MARFTNSGGTITGVPGVRQSSLRRAGGSVPSPLESGVVAIFGECAGTIQPATKVEYRDPQRLADELVSGDLYDACRFAFNPSYDDPNIVKGASKVIAIRANPATQSSASIDDGAGDDLIDLTSRGYGGAENGISIQSLVAGSSGGLGKSITLAKTGKTNETKDDLGFNPIFAINYAGSGSAATMTISRTQLTTSVTGSSPAGSEDLTIDFSVFDTITKMVDYINSTYSGSYSIEVVTAKPDTYKCEDLDFVTAADIFPVSGTLSLASTTATTYTVGSLSGESTGDILSVGSEFLYIEDASTKTVTRGYMDSTPAVHATVTATTYYAAGGVNKAIIDWVNTYSQFASAVRNTAYNDGIPGNTLVVQYFTGGTEGVAAAADWQNALDVLRDEKVNFICTTSTDSTVHAKLSTHLAQCWGKLGIEAIGHVGATADETLNQLKTRAKGLQDSNLALWFQSVTRDNDQGVATEYGPWALAVIKAATQAGMAFGEALTHKTTRCSNLSQNSGIDLFDDEETLIEYGISFDRYSDGQYRTIRCLSTWTNNDDDEKIEMNVRHSVAWTLYKVRDRLRFYHLGRKARSGNALSMKSTVVRALTEIRDVDKAIVKGSKRENGAVVDIPAFDPDSISISQTGNEATVEYDFTPAGATDFINVASIIKQFQDVA